MRFSPVFDGFLQKKGHTCLDVFDVLNLWKITLDGWLRRNPSCAKYCVLMYIFLHTAQRCAIRKLNSEVHLNDLNVNLIMQINMNMLAIVLCLKGSTHVQI